MFLLGLWGFLFGFRRFLFERREGGDFVELVVASTSLMFLFRDGLAQFFVRVSELRDQSARGVSC